MKVNSIIRSIIIGVSLSAVFTGASLRAESLSDQEQRGKQIYFQGTSPKGSLINAKIGSSSVDMPASVVPCASCHGRDGKGRPEGAVVPPDITWSHLMHPDGHQHPYGRSHTAFDDRKVMQAIVFGKDPSGNKLDTAMPRYDMSKEDMLDLVAYMKRIETDLDPGVINNEIKLGTILPTRGRLAPLGQSTRKFLEAYLKDVNSKGGIHGRKLSLAVAEVGDEREKSLWAIRDLLRRDDVFALLGSVSIGYEQELVKLSEEFEMPVVGSHTLFPYEPDAHPYVFYLQAGVVEQAQAMVKFVSDNLQFITPSVAVVYSDLELYAPILEGVNQQAKAQGWKEPLAVKVPLDNFDAKAIAKQLSKEHVEVVLFFERGDRFVELSKAMRSEDLMPHSLMPGALVGNSVFEIPEAYLKRIYVSFPVMPSDHSKQGVAQFENLHSTYKLDYSNSGVQVSAMNAANVMVEALKRTGSELSREKLMDTLQSMNDFEPGLISSVSYNTRRRIGAWGSHIVQVDLVRKRLDPNTTWVTLER